MQSDVTSRLKKPEIQTIPVLVLTLDGTQVATYPLTKRCITIGRSIENDISLDDTGVSRHHAQIITVHGVSVIEDLGSRNGSYVNYKWTRTRQLEAGDDIIIAKFRLQFREQAASENTNADLATLMRKWQRGSAASQPTLCPACGHAS